MAKKKLTIAARESIARAIVNHKYDQIRDASEALEFSIAQELYEFLYADWMTIMKKMPSGAFQTCHTITAGVDGKWHNLRFQKSKNRKKEGSNMYENDPAAYRRVFYSSRHFGPVASTEDKTGFAARIDALFTDREFARQDEENTLVRVSKLIGTYNYWEDLEANWVEALPIIDRVRNSLGVERPVSQLPAVIPADLNKMLDLPPEV